MSVFYEMIVIVSGRYFVYNVHTWQKVDSYAIPFTILLS